MIKNVWAQSNLLEVERSSRGPGRGQAGRSSVHGGHWLDSRHNELLEKAGENRNRKMVNDSLVLLGGASQVEANGDEGGEMTETVDELGQGGKVVVNVLERDRIHCGGKKKAELEGSQRKHTHHIVWALGQQHKRG